MCTLMLVHKIDSNIAEKEIDNKLELGDIQPTEDLQIRGREEMQLAERVTKVQFSDKDYAIDNVLRETPSKILEREYMLFSNNLTVPTMDVKPYEILLNLPQIQRALYGFKFFKAGIKIRVLINSTPMYYGMLSVSWLPDTVNFPPSLVDITNADPMIMDISTKDVLEFDLPYISLYDSIKVTNLYTSTSTPTVHFETLGYAQADSTMPTITYSVYGSFTQPQAWGSQSVVTVVSQSGRLLDLDYIRADSGELEKQGREMVPYESSKAMQTADKTLGIVAAASSVIPVVGPIISAIVSTAKMGLMAHDMAADAYERYEGYKKVDKEDLPDPLRHNPSAVRAQAFGDLASTVYAPAMNLTSNLSSYFPPFHKGDPDMKHRIYDALRIPTIRSVHSLTGSPPNVQILFQPLSTFDTSVARMSYMDLIGSLFRFWRGSIKVSLFFYTSPFISATYRLLLFNVDGDPEPLATDPSVYAFKKVITVRGSTRVDIVVPYLSVVPWQPLNAFPGAYPVLAPPLPVSKLYLETVTPPNSIGDQAPYVFVMTVISAGDDFQVKDLRSPTPTRLNPVLAEQVSERKIKSQMRLRTDFHKNARDNLAAGTNNFVKLKDLYEDEMTFEDASNRFSSRPSNGFNFEICLPYNPVNLVSTDVFDFVQSMFRYVRGSVRIKQIGNQPVYGALMFGNLRNYSLSVAYDRAQGNGGGQNTLAQNQVFEFEVPYMCQTEWIPTTMVFPGSAFTIQPTSVIVEVQDYSTTQIYAAAGRDYQLAFLLPPRSSFSTIPAWVD